jgi:hypothetical protein
MQQRESITRNTTRRARVQAHGAKQYGGSTGGRKSLAGGNQALTMQAHNEEALERSKTFKEQSMGSQFKNDWKSSANLMNAGQRNKLQQKDMSS